MPLFTYILAKSRKWVIISSVKTKLRGRDLPVNSIQNCFRTSFPQLQSYYMNWERTKYHMLKKIILPEKREGRRNFSARKLYPKQKGWFAFSQKRVVAVVSERRSDGVLQVVPRHPNNLCFAYRRLSGDPASKPYH